MVGLRRQHGYDGASPAHPHRPLPCVGPLQAFGASACAAVGTAESTEYTHEELDAIVRAVEAWEADVDTSECNALKTNVSDDAGTWGDDDMTPAAR